MRARRHFDWVGSVSTERLKTHLSLSLPSHRVCRDLGIELQRPLFERPLFLIARVLRDINYVLTGARRDRAKDMFQWILGKYNGGGDATSFEYLRVGRQEGDPLAPHPSSRSNLEFCLGGVHVLARALLAMCEDRFVLADDPTTPQLLQRLSALEGKTNDSCRDVVEAIRQVASSGSKRRAL